MVPVVPGGLHLSHAFGGGRSKPLGFQHRPTGWLLWGWRPCHGLILTLSHWRAAGRLYCSTEPPLGQRSLLWGSKRISCQYSLAIAETFSVFYPNILSGEKHEFWIYRIFLWMMVASSNFTDQQKERSDHPLRKRDSALPRCGKRRYYDRFHSERPKCRWGSCYHYSRQLLMPLTAQTETQATQKHLHWR